MASRRGSSDPQGAPRRRGGWTESEVGPASGGHLAPDRGDQAAWDDPAWGDDKVADHPLFEPDEPRRGPGPQSGPEPLGGYATQRMPATDRPAPVRRKTPVRRRVAARRVKRTVKHIDPMSVLKVSGFFYVFFLVAWLILAAILYSVIAATGIFDLIQEVANAFGLAYEVQINLWFVERWAFLIGFVIAVVGLLVNTISAFLYNVAADTIGGVEVTFVERDG